MDISIMRIGRAQMKRKSSHMSIKEPPPNLETILGKRHIFPVPTAMPNPANIIPHLEAKTSFLLIRDKFNV